MKISIFLAFSLFSSLSFACADISGKFLCPEEAASPMALGTREVQFVKSTIVDMYSMKLGEETLMFEVDAWNPGINPTTGEIDFKVETMAECKDDTVLLNEKVTEEDQGIKLTVQ